MKVVSATSARANLFGLIDQVTEEHEEVMITTKRKNAVLVSEEDWRSMQETIYLTSVPGLVKAVREASNTPDDEWVSHEEVIDMLDSEDR